MYNYSKTALRLTLTTFLITRLITSYAQDAKTNTNITNYLTAVDSAFVQDNTARFNHLVPLRKYKAIMRSW
jgi:hypothetical protein